MGVAAQGTVWSIAPQASGKYGDAAFVVGDHTWRKFRVPSITGGGMQNQANLPLELGGTLVPTGAYKAGAFLRQAIDIIPRLENTLGYLLYATMGAVSSVDASRYTASGWVAQAGIKGHLFRFPTDNANLPWLATRVSIPTSTSGEPFGEVGWDCRIQGLSLDIPGAGLITGSIGITGRKFTHPDHGDVSAWAYDNAFEDASSIAHAGKGSLKIGSTIPKITALRLQINNNIADPQRMMIVGSYFPDDLPVLSRDISMRATVRWTDSTLWRQIFDGGAAGNNFDPLPYFSESVGNVKGFYFEAQSPDVITGTSQPYAIRIMANNVVMSYEPGSMRLRGGDIIEFGLNIDVQEAGGGTQDYIQIALDNGQASYAWT